MLNGVKARAAILGAESVEEKARRAGMIGRRARPKYAVLRVEPFIGDAGIVGDCSRRRPAQLFESFARVRREVAAVAGTIGKRFQDLVVGPDTLRRSFDPVPENDAPFEVGYRPFLFGPLGDGQDNIGERGGLGKEWVGDH